MAYILQGTLDERKKQGVESELSSFLPLSQNTFPIRAL